MSILSELPLSGVAVICVILALFILSLLLLFITYGRYRREQKLLAVGGSAYSDALEKAFSKAYRKYGQSTNTPAIIDSVFSDKLSGPMLFERFINNAVSLFVTLGLFGTFLGLSLSVSSLTELLKLSGTEEWLGILNSVGGGLLSSLSGMGVAFYTSLFGVACSIVLTVLRTVWNPQTQRERLITSSELYLDHTVAVGLTTEFAFDDESRMLQLKDELRAHAAAVEKSLSSCTYELERSLSAATRSLSDMIERSKEPIGAFYDTVNCFNENVRDFSEFNYDLRGNIERMDVCFRDLAKTISRENRSIEGGRRNETR